MRINGIVFIAAIMTALPAAAKPPQVLPEPMLVNLFALTNASAALRICADSSAFAGLSSSRKDLLRRLNRRIDGMVKLIAVKFDDDLFGFFEVERDKVAKNPQRIARIRRTYGDCGDALFERMKWYVHDSRQKLEHFLSQMPDAK